MPQSLPLRVNLEWLKKAAKERLVLIRAQDPAAKLSDAQLAVAQEYGFASWRKLKVHVELVRDKLDEAAKTVQVAVAAAGPVSPDDADLTALFAAIKEGEMPVISQLLDRRPELAQAHGPDGQTPLHAAAQFNDPQLAVTLVACGADPNARYGQSGHTPLSWAVTCNAIECAQALVRAGLKPDLFCAAGIGALDHVRSFFDETGALVGGAAKTGSSRMTDDGTRLPCPPESPVEQISDALYIACRNRQVDVVRFLLTKGPDLSFRAFQGGTPLHWAYFGGSSEVIELLLTAGADPNSRDNDLRSSPRAFGICIPVSWGFAWLVKQRLAADPSLANLMDGHTSPLCEAARGGHAGVVQLLLEAGADPTRTNSDGQTPYDLATAGGHAKVAELLTRAGGERLTFP